MAATEKLPGHSGTGRDESERESRGWLDRLRAEGTSRERTISDLHQLLLRAARRELRRRRHQVGSIEGPELEDLAAQSADDAVVKVLEKLDQYRGASRFTTWAYKFAIFEVSAKVARHQWRNRPAGAEARWESIADAVTLGPAEGAEKREALAILARAIEDELTDRQRRVFVAVALNEVPIDVLAVELGTNRNAVYKNLFDARRKLRAILVGAGHDPGGGR